MDIFTYFFIIAIFCFTVIFWIKRGENKYRYQKTNMVDQFIQQHHIHVNKIYSGKYLDLINDTLNRNIWFFVLEQKTLKYKRIPYEDLYYVAYKLDGNPIEAAARSGQMKREMLGGDGPNQADIIPPIDGEDIKVVKEISLTLIVDDRHASTIDLLFLAQPFMTDIKHAKDADAKTWYRIFTNIIEEAEKELL